MNIAKNLYYLRKKEKLTLHQLEALSSVPHSVISRIENGATSDPSISTVIKLSQALHISLEEFLFKDLDDKSFEFHRKNKK